MSIAMVARPLREPESVSKRSLVRVQGAAAVMGCFYNPSAGDVLAGLPTEMEGREMPPRKYRLESELVIRHGIGPLRKKASA